MPHLGVELRNRKPIILAAVPITVPAGRELPATRLGKKEIFAIQEIHSTADGS